MNKKLLLVFVCFLFLSGCNTMPIINLANETKCVTQIATKESKVTCEIEGKKVFAKK